MNTRELIDKQDRLDELTSTLHRWYTRRTYEETSECSTCGGTLWFEWDDMDRGDGMYRATGCIDCMEREADRLTNELEVEEGVVEAEQAEAVADRLAGK